MLTLRETSEHPALSSRTHRMIAESKDLPLEETRHPYTGSASRWGCAAKAGRAGMLTRNRDGRVHLVEVLKKDSPISQKF
jgi:hypothetical protein